MHSELVTVDTVARESVRIGVAGHRCLAEVGKLEAAAERALRMVARQYPGRRMIAVSELAEGADRLVTRVVLRTGGGLVVCLPLEVPEYLKRFDSKESKAEFMELLAMAEEVWGPPTGLSDEMAYEEAGRQVVEQSDLLVALWDGMPARGRGGTGDVVSLALGMGKPVIHIWAGNQLLGTTVATCLANQGEITVYNLRRIRGPLR